MDIDEETKNIIIELLLYCPRDLEDGVHIYRSSRYESTEERLVVDDEEEYYTREIGASNLFSAMTFISNYLCEKSEEEVTEHTVADCFKGILVELEKLHIIRELPEIKRSNFSVVSSNKKGSVNISVDKG